MMINYFAIMITLIVAGNALNTSEGDKHLSPSPLSGMVEIPGGKHTLFLESESGEAVYVESFKLDIRAVTNAEYLEFVKANPKWAKSKIPAIYGDAGYLKHWQGDFEVGRNFEKIKNSPVTNVSWHAANAYAKWKGKRLPTAVEWEYAASAGITGNERPLEEVIFEWYSKPTPDIIAEVGTTFKNKYGLYDMHGLVWEWVYDFNSIVMDSDSRSNLALDRNLFCASGSFGVANKEDYASFMRFAFRGSLESNYTVSNLGFRCAIDADENVNND